MTWTLNLHRMHHASSLDGRTHDLIAGMPDYGLTGIHDDLEYHVAADVAPDSTPTRMPDPASVADLGRRIENRARRKTWRVTHSNAAPRTVRSQVQRDTDDPVDRA
jgi:hypothetical protein